MLLQHPQAGMNSGSKSLHILGINQDLYIVLPRLHGAYGGKLQLRGDRHNGEKKNSATRHCFPVWRSHLPPEPLKSPPHCRLQSSVEASGWKEGGSHGGREQFHAARSELLLLPSFLQHMPSISTAAVWSFKSSLQVCLLLA